MRQDLPVTSEVSLILPGAWMLRGPQPETLSIKLPAPLSGVMGISGPSILNCALLAAEHVAERTGVRIELVVVDAGRGVDDVVGVWRASSPTSNLLRALSGRTPPTSAPRSKSSVTACSYITPPHEREPGRSGTVFIGSGPQLQLEGPLKWIIGHHRVRRWALIGNDYIWPRQIHRTASRVLRGLGQSVVMDRLVPRVPSTQNAFWTKRRRTTRTRSCSHWSAVTG